MDNLVNWRMPVLEGKKEIVIGSKVSQSEFDVLQRICKDEDRSMSYVLRELAMRGLAQYFHDGKVKPDTAESELIKRATKPNGFIPVAPKSKSPGIPMLKTKETHKKKRVTK